MKRILAIFVLAFSVAAFAGDAPAATGEAAKPAEGAKTEAPAKGGKKAKKDAAKEGEKKTEEKAAEGAK